MNKEINNQNAYRKAKRKVAAKIGFKTHFIIYINVCLILYFINVSNIPDVPWFRLPLIGWGIGVIIHGLRVYTFSGKLLFTEEMVRKEMEREG